MNIPKRKVIAVDLDGTLAHYTHWPQDGSIGAPVPAMANRVRRWLLEGHEVRIFTARVCPHGRGTDSGLDATEQFCADQHSKINRWCEEHLGVMLPVTYMKHPDVDQFWDDRAVFVVPNEGTVAPNIFEIHPEHLAHLSFEQRDMIDAALAANRELNRKLQELQACAIRQENDLTASARTIINQQNTIHRLRSLVDWRADLRVALEGVRETIQGFITSMDTLDAPAKTAVDNDR